MFLRPLYRRPVTDTVTDESIIFITWAFYITINIKRALEALRGISEVTVTGSGTKNDPWVIVFEREDEFADLTSKDQPTEITISRASITSVPIQVVNKTIQEYQKAGLLNLPPEKLHQEWLWVEPDAGYFTITLEFYDEGKGSYVRYTTNILNAENLTSGNLEDEFENFSNYGISIEDIEGTGQKDDPWKITFSNPKALIEFSVEEIFPGRDLLKNLGLLVYTTNTQTSTKSNQLQELELERGAGSNADYFILEIDDISTAPIRYGETPENLKNAINRALEEKNIEVSVEEDGDGKNQPWIIKFPESVTSPLPIKIYDDVDRKSEIDSVRNVHTYKLNARGDAVFVTKDNLPNVLVPDLDNGWGTYTVYGDTSDRIDLKGYGASNVSLSPYDPSKSQTINIYSHPASFYENKSFWL